MQGWKLHVYTEGQRDGEAGMKPASTWGGQDGATYRRGYAAGLETRRFHAKRQPSSVQAEVQHGTRAQTNS